MSEQMKGQMLRISKVEAAFDMCYMRNWNEEQLLILYEMYPQPAVINLNEIEGEELKGSLFPEVVQDDFKESVSYQEASSEANDDQRLGGIVRPPDALPTVGQYSGCPDPSSNMMNNPNSRSWMVAPSEFQILHAVQIVHQSLLSEFQPVEEFLMIGPPGR